MASTGHVCVWLGNKKSYLKPFYQINWNLVGGTHGRFSIIFSYGILKSEGHMLRPPSL